MQHIRFQLDQPRFGAIATAIAVAFLFAAQAQATGGGYPPPDPGPPTPDAEVCATIVESDFGAFTIEKCVEVWASDNAGNPMPVPGNFTYVYTLANDAGSFTNIIQFFLETPVSANSVGDAGFFAASGNVEPSSTDFSVPGQVLWEFLATPLPPGEMSAPLYVISPYGPGGVTDNVVVASDDFGLDEASTCIGPSTLPDPSPCSVFFWKLRALKHFFVKKHFHDTRFDEIAQWAADNSTVFDTAEDVVNALFGGNWYESEDKQAKRTLAALLLNVGAGHLFPGNTKCRLFLDTPIDTDDDGIDDTTVGEQIVDIESGILSNDDNMKRDRRHRCHSMNHGHGVRRSTKF